MTPPAPVAAAGLLLLLFLSLSATLPEHVAGLTSNGSSTHSDLSLPISQRPCSWQGNIVQATSADEIPCTCLGEAVSVEHDLDPSRHRHYHFRVEDLSIVNMERPEFSVRVSPCQGSVALWVKTNPQPWPNEYDFRYESNNTEGGSVKKVKVNLYNRDYYITVGAEQASNYSIVAYTNRDMSTMPPVPGEGGFINVTQPDLYDNALRVQFYSAAFDPEASYQVFVSEPGIEGEDLPFCADYSAREPCRIAYTSCGILMNMDPLDDGGWEPIINNTLVTKWIRRPRGSTWVINAVVRGSNGLMTAYVQTKGTITASRVEAAVSNEMQIIIMSIAGSVVFVVAVILGIAFLKFRKAVSMPHSVEAWKKKKEQPSMLTRVRNRLCPCCAKKSKDEDTQKNKKAPAQQPEMAKGKSKSTLQADAKAGGTKPAAALDQAASRTVETGGAAAPDGRPSSTPSDSSTSTSAYVSSNSSANAEGAASKDGAQAAPAPPPSKPDDTGTDAKVSGSRPLFRRTIVKGDGPENDASRSAAASGDQSPARPPAPPPGMSPAQLIKMELRKTVGKSASPSKSKAPPPPGPPPAEKDGN